MAQRALAWVAQRALAWVAVREAATALRPEGEEEALRPEGEVGVSCLLPQPRYRPQEVRVPFERIGRVRLCSCRVGDERVGLHGFYGLPSS